MEVLRDGCWQASERDPGDAWSDVVAGQAVDGAARGPGAVLGGHRSWAVERRCRYRGWCVIRGWGQVVPPRWRDAPLELAPTSGRYLSFAEREEIAILAAQQAGVREIARRVGRSPSTISRELRRNGSTRSYGAPYRATTARWHSERRASRPKVSKLAANDTVRAYVQDRLAARLPGPAVSRFAGPDVRWIGRRHGRRADRRWAKSWTRSRSPTGCGSISPMMGPSGSLTRRSIRRLRPRPRCAPP